MRAAAVEKAVASAACNLGVNMLSANEELVQAHRQLCSILNLAEVKQRVSLERLKKQSRIVFLTIQRVVLIVEVSAGIGGAIGGGIAALLLR